MRPQSYSAKIMAIDFQGLSGKGGNVIEKIITKRQINKQQQKTSFLKASN